MAFFRIIGSESLILDASAPDLESRCWVVWKSEILNQVQDDRGGVQDDKEGVQDDVGGVQDDGELYVADSARDGRSVDAVLVQLVAE